MEYLADDLRAYRVNILAKGSARPRRSGVASTLAETPTYLGGVVEIPRISVPEPSSVGAA